MWTWKSHLRFTTREMAIFAVIVGLFLAWALDHQRLQGSLRYTGNPLDLAIEGEGFFSLTDEKTTSTVYTRRGDFCTNANDLLVVRLNGVEWPISPSVCIPPDAGAIVITPCGLVLVQVPGTVKVQAWGQLQLAKFDKPGKLRALSASVYADTDQSGPAAFARPGTRGVGLVRQCMLERSGFQKFSFSPWR